MTEEELRSRWPAAFNDARLPLKRGIHLDLGIAYPDPAETLRHWTTHPVYLRNQLAKGAKRINLDGEPVEDVSAGEKLHAWWALRDVREWIYRWHREKLQNPIKRRWLPFSVEDEKAEMRLAMPKMPKGG